MGILATLIVNIGEFFVRKGVNFLVCEMRTKSYNWAPYFFCASFFPVIISLQL